MQALNDLQAVPCIDLTGSILDLGMTALVVERLTSCWYMAQLGNQAGVQSPIKQVYQDPWIATRC
jgi:hypothetical protein